MKKFIMNFIINLLSKTTLIIFMLTLPVITVNLDLLELLTRTQQKLSGFKKWAYFFPILPIIIVLNICLCCLLIFAFTVAWLHQELKPFVE